MRLSVRLGVKRKKEKSCPLPFKRSLGFSRALASAPDTTKARCFSRHMSPLSGQSDSGAGACQREKRSPAGARASVPKFVCVATFLGGRPLKPCHSCRHTRGRPTHEWRTSAPRHRQSLLQPRLGILTQFPFAVRGMPTKTLNVN